MGRFYAAGVVARVRGMSTVERARRYPEGPRRSRAMRLFFPLLIALAVAACATTAPGDEPPVPEGADRSVRTEANGDVIEEYRIAGQLRMVRVTPRRGPTYYLVDENADGIVDITRGGERISPVYFKLFGW